MPFISSNKFPSVLNLVKCYNENVYKIFLKMYFCSHWYYHAVLILYFINVVYTCMRMDAQSFQLFAIPWTVAKFLCPWVFSGRNTGIGCHFLLQGILLTQGSNPSLLHGRQILYHCTTLEAFGLIWGIVHQPLIPETNTT